MHALRLSDRRVRQAPEGLEIIEHAMCEPTRHEQAQEKSGYNYTSLYPSRCHFNCNLFADYVLSFAAKMCRADRRANMSINVNFN